MQTGVIAKISKDDRFKQCMLVMTLRIFADVTGWQLRRCNPTDRDVVFRFFFMVFGKQEGRAALYEIEKQISEMFDSEP